MSAFINIGLCNINDILIVAIEKSLADSINVLYRHGVNINYEDKCHRSALMIAINKHDIECIKQLINFNANVNIVNSEDDTILTYIARQRHGDYTKELQLLVLSGAIVNMVNTSSELPLHIAVTYTNVKTVKELLLLGADVDGRDHVGETPLIMASKTNSPSCIELLLSFGANPNTQPQLGETALMMCLHHAHTTQCIEIVNLLYKKTDLNLRNRHGDTALFYAIHYNNIDIVRILLSNGAYMYIKNTYGITPFLLAIMDGHDKLAKYLIEERCAISGMIINLHWTEYPLVFLHIIKQLDIVINESSNCEELNKLFFGAGEYTGIIHHPHRIAQEAMDKKCILLKSIIC